MNKRLISYLIVLVGIPAVIALGFTVFAEVKYIYVALAVAALSLAPFLIRFEKKDHSVTYLLLIAVFTALSVIGRLAFSAVQAFKPVTAVVVIAAMYFGPEAGFLVGSLSALLSNFYFGQGPWTVFQMAAWGLVGFLAGLLAEKLKQSLVLLSVYGALSGVAYSLMLDVWHAMYADGLFSWGRYVTAVTTSVWFTVMYAISNVVFLLLLARPIGKKLDRIKTKYGI